VSTRIDSYRHPGYEKYSKIGWGLLLRNKHSLFALLICFFGIFNMTFFQSFLTVEIQKEQGDGGLGVSESGSAFMIATINFFYLAGCILLPYVFGFTPRKL
jgi:hypothetical protein